MKNEKIEIIIEKLRIRSKSDPQDQLENILSAFDQHQPINGPILRSRQLKIRWTAGLVMAAILLLVFTLRITQNTPQPNPTHKGRTMAVPQYQINTAGSLQRTFCQEGLAGLERQLDQASKIYGPSPTVPLEVDLF